MNSAVNSENTLDKILGNKIQNKFKKQSYTDLLVKYPDNDNIEEEKQAKKKL